MENNKTIIYSNSKFEIYVNLTNTILYVEVIDGTYNKKNFNEAIDYYKNFWMLANSSGKIYYQVFIFNNVKIYPLEFYTTVFETLKGLESIFNTNLHSSCLVNNSNAMDILRPLLNMYKAVRPFNFVKTLEEGHLFINNNRLIDKENPELLI